MHTFLLSIGSNTFAKANMKKVRKTLNLCFPDIFFTRVIESPSYGNKYKRPFLNMLGMFHSTLDTNEINAILKEIEKKMGRRPEDKQKGRVVVDIDLIRTDNRVLRPKDFGRSYVQELLGDV